MFHSRSASSLSKSLSLGCAGWFPSGSRNGESPVSRTAVTQPSDQRSTALVYPPRADWSTSLRLCQFADFVKEVKGSRSTVFKGANHRRHALNRRLHQSSASEIREDHSASVCEGRHEDIVRFEIPVHNVTIVKIIQRHQYLSDYDCRPYVT